MEVERCSSLWLGLGLGFLESFLGVFLRGFRVGLFGRAREAGVKESDAEKAMAEVGRNGSV